MVEIIENWSDIKGIIKSIKPSSSMNDFIEVNILVEKITDVPGYPNLLESMEGSKIITAYIRSTIAHTLFFKTGKRISCRIRRTGVSTIFIHPTIVSVYD